ncbi:MAG: alpha/beta hydrolase [Pseudomonadota bacterium]
MPIFERTTATGPVALHYEISGSGFPILAIAPGGMRSAIPFWDNAPWNPVTGLADTFQVIAMDQRNAGQSTGPVTAADGWNDFRADQLALLDHLGVERCHVVGMCIGGSYGLGLIEAAPERIAAAVLYQPIGLDGNRDAFFAMFDDWAAALKPERADVSDAAWDAFKHRMYDGDFVFNLDRDAVARLRTPLLIPMGEDLYHPRSISEAIVALVPAAELLPSWKTGADVAAAEGRVRAFLGRHTPA